MPSFQVIYQAGYEIIDGIKKCWRTCSERTRMHQHSHVQRKISSIFPNAEIAMRIFSVLS
jgi:hypothetical protein